MDIWSDRDASACNVVILVSTMCAGGSLIVCSPLTAVQHSDSHPFLSPPICERGYLLVKRSASPRDSQEAKKETISLTRATDLSELNGYD